MTSRHLQCVVVTPERAVLDERSDFVALPMFDGELGVLPGRAPLIGRLGCGELRTVQGANTRRFFIDGGFVQIRHNVVTVLTSKALPAEDISLAEAEKKLQQALKETITPQGKEVHYQAQQRARAQIRIAQKSSGSQPHLSH